LCSICLDPMVKHNDDYNDDPTILLKRGPNGPEPCHPTSPHIFHLKCISTWLMDIAAFSSPSCPTCRSPLAPDSGIRDLVVLQRGNKGNIEHCRKLLETLIQAADDDEDEEEEDEFSFEELALLMERIDRFMDYAAKFVKSPGFEAHKRVLDMLWASSRVTEEEIVEYLEDNAGSDDVGPGSDYDAEFVPGTESGFEPDVPEIIERMAVLEMTAEEPRASDVAPVGAEHCLGDRGTDL